MKRILFIALLLPIVGLAQIGDNTIVNIPAIGTGNQITDSIQSASLESQASGVIDFDGPVTINVDPTKIDIPAGNGIIINSFTNPDIPVITHVSWLEQTISVPNLSSVFVQGIHINSSGIGVIGTCPAGPEVANENIILGCLFANLGSAEVKSIVNAPTVVNNAASTLIDYARNEFKSVEGGVLLPNSGSNLELTLTEILYREIGINWHNNRSHANDTSFAQVDILTFSYITADGTIDVSFEDITDIRPGFYQPLGVGSVIAVPGSSSRATISYLWAIPGISEFFIVYPQAFYSNITEAKDNIRSDISTTIFPSALEAEGELVGAVITISTALDLTNVLDGLILNNAQGDISISSSGDNLGNHIMAQNLNGNGFDILDVGDIAIGTSTTSHVLTINTAGQTGLLEPSVIIQGEGNNERIQIEAYGAVNIPAIQGLGSGGTIATPTATPINKTLLLISGRGFDNDATPAITSNNAIIRLRAASNFTTTSQPTRIEFETTPVSSTTSIERMRITQDGDVGIGIDPEEKFHVFSTTTLNAKFESDVSSSIVTRDNGSGVNLKSMQLLNSDGKSTFRALNDLENAAIVDNIIVMDHSDGKVGIGTATPVAALHVSAADGLTAIRVSNTSGTLREWEFGVLQTGSFRLVDVNDGSTSPIQVVSGAGSNALNIGANGRIGLGGSANSSSILDLQGTDGVLLNSRLSTTNRNALTPVNGMLFYNSTSETFQGRQAGSWVDFATSAAVQSFNAFSDSNVTLELTNDVWEPITNATFDLFDNFADDDMTFDGDSIVINIAGDYVFHGRISFTGGNNDEYRNTISVNGIAKEVFYDEVTPSSASAHTNTNFIAYVSLAVNDVVKPIMMNFSNGTNAIIKTGLFYGRLIK